MALFRKWPRRHDPSNASSEGDQGPTDASDRLHDAEQYAPQGFRYPERLLATLAMTELPVIDPWMWTSDHHGQSKFWAEIVAKQFPDRVLVPFAKHGGSDDVFCFDGGDHGGDPAVLVIHTFTQSGWEDRRHWPSFDAWWEEMEQQHADWLAEESADET